jgi:hypothetical protein
VLHTRFLHTDNEIYKPAKGGTIPTMVGELICAMMEGQQLQAARSQHVFISSHCATNQYECG